MNRREGRVTLAGVRALLGLVACAAFALGCGSPDGAANCPAVSQVCPSPAPTFSGQAQAIIRSTCQPCHEAGGQEAVRPMQTYAQIRALAPDILSQVVQCRMPILPDGSVSSFADADDRDTLIAWLVCGAMNN
jgi:hypothetical protein